MSDRDETNMQAPEAGGDTSKVSVSRRNFAKAGVGAPVLMSLVNQPAWGVERIVCGVSALASGNTSTTDQNQSCGGTQIGCSPGFWKNNGEAWGATPWLPGVAVQGKEKWNTNTATKFVDVFGFTPAGFSPTADDGVLRLIDVLLQPSVAGNYYFHLVAGVLNAAAGPSIYGATPADIIEAANAVEPSGFGTFRGASVSRDDVYSMLMNMQHLEGNECFLNAHGECADGYVGFEGVCYLVCPEGTNDDDQDGTCVADSTPP